MVMASTEQMAASNTKMINLLLSPLEGLYNILKMLLVVAAVLLLTIFNQTAWLINMGDRSQAVRTAQIEGIQQALAEAQSVTSDRSLRYGIWQADLNTGHVRSASGTTVQEDPLTELSADEARIALDPSKGSWSDRSDRSLVRQSARMYGAYVTGQFMTEALHAELGHHARFNAPTVRLEMVDLITVAPGLRTVADGQITHPAMLSVIGLCLATECSSEDFTYTSSKWDDLFATTLPLSRGQENAVAALNAMGTDAFWLRAAHANGDHRDAHTLAAAQAARAALVETYWPQGIPDGFVRQ